jgi:uncharacterized YigZ family protein
MSDSYKTIIEKSSEILHKDRGSKFYATAFPFTHEEQLTRFIDELRTTHPKAGHHCYAWKLGANNDRYRANDDGEPSYSAGEPILSQINARDMSDVLVVVSRIFGGTKLGVGGLIQAYRQAASLALDQVTLVNRVLTETVYITFEYPQMSQVMRFIDDKGFSIIDQRFLSSCAIDIAVPKSQVNAVVDQVNSMYPIKASLQADS